MTDGDVANELRLLRGMVRSLEEELSTSQAKHQRLMMKRNKQCRLLIDEVSHTVSCISARTCTIYVNIAKS